MSKDSSFIIKSFHSTMVRSLYTLVFLLPLFFLPWTSDALDFNKQALLLALVFLATVAWMAKSLVSGKVAFNPNRVNLAVAALVVVFLISAIFSVFKVSVLWGWPQPSYESLISLVCFCLVYFLVSADFSQKDLQRFFPILSASFLLAAVYGILQLLGIHIFSFSFAKSMYFNTVGSVSALGLLAISLLPLFIILLIGAKAWWRFLYATNVALVFLLLVLINYTYLWLLAMIAGFLLALSWIFKRDMFSGTWMFLPTFFFVVSLFFMVIHPQLDFLNNQPAEIILSAPATLKLAGRSLAHTPLQGSGPGSFAYDFLKYNDGSLNNTSFWNVQFNFGFSKFFTTVATLGVLGILAWLALISYLFWQGAKAFVAKSNLKGQDFSLLVAVLAGVVLQSMGWFFFNTSIALESIFFLFAGILVAMLYKDRINYVLKPSSLLTLGVTFAFTLAAIFGAGFLILESRRYVANLSYSSAMVMAASGDIDEAQKLMERATSLDASDLYFRQLSRVYLLKIQSIAKTVQNPGDKQTEELKALISNAVNSAKLATDIGPHDVNNWSFRAGIYQNLIGLVDDATAWAFSSYDAAIQLNPTNPYLYLQKGLVYYQQKDYQNAKISLEKALALKPDYADALYSLGLAYDNLGQKSKALELFAKLYDLGNHDPAIIAIIDNLKAGRPALGELTPPTSPALQAPVK